MKKEYPLLVDLLFYFILPILFWEFGRGYLSDYTTILGSVFPGIFYSFYRFFKTKEVNFTRIYLFTNIIIGLFSDLCAGSALQLMWNDAFYSLGLSLFFFASCYTKRPLFYYFSLDIYVLQGYDKKLTKEILRSKESLRILRLLTLLNSIRELLFTGFLMKLLPIYGIEIYTISILIDQIFSFLMSGGMLVGCFILYKHMTKITVVKKLLARKNRIRISREMTDYVIEYGYFFLRKHFM